MKCLRKASHATEQAISDADRLEWIFFSEYAPYDSEIQGSIMYQSGAGQDFGWQSLHKALSGVLLF